jgi:hypothetical protein
MCFGQIHPFCCSFLSFLPPFNWVLLFYLHTCMIIIIPPFSPHVTLFLFPKLVPVLHSHHLLFSFHSRLCIWERTYMPYLSFIVWLILLHMTISSSIHLPTNNITSFFFMNNTPLCLHNTFSSPFIGGWLITSQPHLYNSTLPTCVVALLDTGGLFTPNPLHHPIRDPQTLLAAWSKLARLEKLTKWFTRTEL